MANAGLNYIQMGREGTAGTAVAASTIWRGPMGGGIDDGREVQHPDEDIGVYPGADRSYIPRLTAALAIPQTEATYEQIPHLFEGGVMTTTPSQDGSGSDYIYTYNFPTTSSPTLKTYTFETGDTVQNQEMEYSFCDDFQLSGAAGEALMVQSNWIGRQATNSSKTGALTAPAVNEILVSNCSFFIDDSGGTVGTTQVSNNLVSVAFNYDTGWAPYWTADDLFFEGISLGRPVLTVDVTFYHDSAANTEVGNWKTEALRLLRFQFEDASAFSMAGTTYSNPTFIFDMAGRWTDFSTIEVSDGNTLRTGTFMARYSPTDTLYAQALFAIESATLP